MRTFLTNGALARTAEAPDWSDVAKNVHGTGHPRLPRYIRGKRGAIDRVRGSQTFPDTNALGLGTYPQYVYSVRFAAKELWGESAEAEQVLYIDLWDSYLVPA